MYKFRNILSKRHTRQLYFSSIHNYLNYPNVPWASANKSRFCHRQFQISNLIPLYRHQKHTMRVIHEKLSLNMGKYRRYMKWTYFRCYVLYTLKPLSNNSLRTNNLLSVWTFKKKKVRPVFHIFPWLSFEQKNSYKQNSYL